MENTFGVDKQALNNIPSKLVASSAPPPPAQQQLRSPRAPAPPCSRCRGGAPRTRPK